MATIEVSEEAGVRYLHFGSTWIQGAMRIARPWSLELEYTREMMLPLLLRDGTQWPRSVLVIGLGAGSLVRFLYRHRPHARLCIVEIEPAVVAAARQFFKLPDASCRLSVEIADGDVYVAGTTRTFDLVLVDGFDAQGRAGALDTEPFYRRLRARLADQGLAVINLLGRSRGFRASFERIRSGFDQHAVALPPTPGGNVIVLGGTGERSAISFVELRAAATRLRGESGLNLHPLLARWEHAHAGTGQGVSI